MEVTRMAAVYHGDKKLGKIDVDQAFEKWLALPQLANISCTEGNSDRVKVLH